MHGVAVTSRRSGGRATCRTRVAIAAASVALVAASPPAHAHLLLTDASLVRNVERADALVVARALSPTTVGDGGARTRFAVLASIAGPAPKGEVEVAGGAPVLRYGAADVVVVLLRTEVPSVQHRPGSAADELAWRSPQVAGTALPVDDGKLSEAARLGLQGLWKATRGGVTTEAQPDGGAGTPQDLAPTVAALVALARAPERKLHTLAGLDLAELAHHPESFAPADRAAIDALLADPHTDAGLRAVLAVTERSLAGGAVRPTETKERSG